MKKYLFLLFLFIIYLILISRNNTANVISYDDKNNSNVIDSTIKFENGINSNSVKKIFNNYKKEYYIYQISEGKNKYKVSCSYIDDCLKEIYKQEDNLFNTTYIASGFIIRELNVIAYEDDIVEFLNKNNLEYKIN